MRSFWLSVLLTLSAGSVDVAGSPMVSAHPAPFRYIGTRHSAETVQRALAIVEPRIPQAIRQAETLLAMRLDPERLDLFLEDIPTANRGVTPRMRMQGVDRQALLVYLEPLLRGDYHDEHGVLVSLTHEMVHAVLRQNIDHAHYVRLPEWFQEGIPHFLLAQSLDKMVALAAINYENPYSVLGGFEGEHFALPEITGGYFFHELESLVGRDGVRDFVGGVLAVGAVDAGFEAVGLLDPEMSESERIEARDAVWSGARQRARQSLERETQDVAGAFFHCKDLYTRGKQDNGTAAISCFEELVATYPGTYAAEVSMYWLAKCHFKRRSAQAALDALEIFDGYQRNYGLLDDSRYYRILLYRELEWHEECKESCRQYLELFPDGAAIAQVREIYEN
jgi:hypothetical protein